jgi:hypothetical protein
MKLRGSCQRCAACNRSGGVRVIPTDSRRVPRLRTCEHCDGGLAAVVRRAA